MIRIIRRYFTQLLSILLALYMVNLSIDAADLEGSFDPSVNEIESAVELVCELMLGNYDFLPERDEADPEGKGSFSNLISIFPGTTIELTLFVPLSLLQEPTFIAIRYADPLLNRQPDPPKGEVTLL